MIVFFPSVCHGSSFKQVRYFLVIFCSFFAWQISVQPFGSAPIFPMPLWHWKHVWWRATLRPGTAGVSGEALPWQFLQAVKFFVSELSKAEDGREWQSLHGRLLMLWCS
jgi:hypothetical protein